MEKIVIANRAVYKAPQTKISQTTNWHVICSSEFPESGFVDTLEEDNDFGW